MFNLEEFQHLLPAAIAWAEDRQAEVLMHGMKLNEFQLELAREVGVAHPENIRIQELVEIPIPEDKALRAAGKKLGLFNWSPAGRAMGYGVEIRSMATDGILPGQTVSPELYRHEFRHVYQCEQCGSTAKFIVEYLHSVLESGYFDSPFEIDARLYETKSVVHN